MTGLYNLIRRNSKLFFKDKGMFFTSLITPVLLLVLYATFLANIYRDSFTSALPEAFVTMYAAPVLRSMAALSSLENGPCIAKMCDGCTPASRQSASDASSGSTRA